MHALSGVDIALWDSWPRRSACRSTECSLCDRQSLRLCERGPIPARDRPRRHGRSVGGSGQKHRDGFSRLQDEGGRFSIEQDLKRIRGSRSASGPAAI
jgi:hypothetical protein